MCRSAFRLARMDKFAARARDARLRELHRLQRSMVWQSKINIR